MRCRERAGDCIEVPGRGHRHDGGISIQFAREMRHELRERVEVFVQYRAGMADREHRIILVCLRYDRQRRELPHVDPLRSHIDERIVAITVVAVLLIAVTAAPVVCRRRRHFHRPGRARQERCCRHRPYIRVAIGRERGEIQDE